MQNLTNTIKISLVTITLIAISSLACGLNKERRAAVKQSTTHTYRIGNIERTYTLIIPDDLPEKPGLVIALHGGGGDGIKMMNYSRLGELALKHRFIGLFPDGVDNHWNDGRAVDGRTADDVAFLSALIEDIKKDHDVDPQKVLITGASNGGFMSAHMVCERSDLFSGAAFVIAGMSIKVKDHCPYPTQIPLMFFKGMADPLVPYEGGTVARNRGEMISTEEELGLWRAKNGCEEQEEEMTTHDRDKNDGIYVEHLTYSKGCEETPIQLYRAPGGGHTWPGVMTQYAPKFFIGEPYDDVDATDEILSYFGFL